MDSDLLDDETPEVALEVALIDCDILNIKLTSCNKLECTDSIYI